MDTILFDPVGEPPPPEERGRKDKRPLDTLQGKTIGYLHIQHESSVEFFGNFQNSVEDLYEPSRKIEVITNGGKFQIEDLEEIIQEADFAVVGVCS